MKKSVETCGRAVSVGGVIQTTDHVGREGRQIYLKKSVGADWPTLLKESPSANGMKAIQKLIGDA